MSNDHAFSLIEIVVVLVIVGILATIAMPNYNGMIMQGSAKAAQNNLTAVYNAQKNYYFTFAAYCTLACSSESAINTTLGLNITDTNFNYSCNNAATGFTCTAANNSDPRLVLTVTNNPIVLTGGSTCASSTGTNPGCNPSCSTDNTAYCPSN